jgi:hypothetical protein
LAAAVFNDFAVNQPGLDDQGRVVEALVLAVGGEVRLGFFTFDFQQQKPDEIHVSFHGCFFPVMI